MINKDHGRGQDLCLRIFKKVRSFTPFDRMSGIRSVSCIRPTCQCRCPPLELSIFAQTLGMASPFKLPSQCKTCSPAPFLNLTWAIWQLGQCYSIPPSLVKIWEKAGISGLQSTASLIIDLHLCTAEAYALYISLLTSNCSVQRTGWVGGGEGGRAPLPHQDEVNSLNPARGGGGGGGFCWQNPKK